MITTPMLRSTVDAAAPVVIHLAGFTAVIVFAWACLTVLGSLAALGAYSVAAEPLFLRLHDQMGVIALVGAAALAVIARLRG